MVLVLDFEAARVEAQAHWADLIKRSKKVVREDTKHPNASLAMPIPQGALWFIRGIDDVITAILFHTRAEVDATIKCLQEARDVMTDIPEPKES